ncbi:MAG: phage tail tube protein [Clostridium sp.]|uniref:phage tail tube protein n=1 Tax=Clostridium sp. TaxID=1506 RepID=UPI003020482F
MQFGIGTKLQIGANSIAELKSIGGLDLKADTVETTTLDSTGGWKEYIQGTKDGGEVSASGYFNPSDTNGQIALYNAFNSGTIINFTILFPPALGASWTFQGIVTGVKTDVNTEDAIPFEATIKVTGKPTLGLTPSNGLTGLMVTGAGGSLTPTFNASNFYYTYSGVTATSVTVTATGVGTLSLYVNGAFVQNLTSGAASNAITLPAIGSTADMFIIHQETGKTQKIYEVIAVKTA